MSEKAYGAHNNSKNTDVKLSEYPVLSTSAVQSSTLD